MSPRPDGLRRDRDGSLVVDAEPAPRSSAAALPAGRSDHGCRRGWRGEDERGHPVPCPVCRPERASPRPPLPPGAPPPPELAALIEAVRRKKARATTTDRPTDDSARRHPMTTTTTTPTSPTAATTAGVDPLRLAALAVHAERAATDLEAVIRDGAGAPTVRTAQDQADRAEARLHRALLTLVPRYERADLDAAIDAAATEAARATRGAR